MLRTDSNLNAHLCDGLDCGIENQFHLSVDNMNHLDLKNLLCLTIFPPDEELNLLSNQNRNGGTMLLLQTYLGVDD